MPASAQVRACACACMHARVSLHACVRMHGFCLRQAEHEILVPHRIFALSLPPAAQSPRSASRPAMRHRHLHLRVSPCILGCVGARARVWRSPWHFPACVRFHACMRAFSCVRAPFLIRAFSCVRVRARVWARICVRRVLLTLDSIHLHVIRACFTRSIEDFDSFKYVDTDEVWPSPREPETPLPPPCAHTHA